MALVTAVAIAVTLGAAAYLDGKYALRKDIYSLRRLKYIEKLYAAHVKENRISLYYFFEASVQRKPNDECIWSREGCYTWTQAYERSHQWANWFLEQGVKPHDYVAFYLTNSPDFIFAWLGLWAIGAAPAMINYNLAGNALIHCLKVSNAKLLLADEEPALRQRVDDVRSQIEGDLGMKISVQDRATTNTIRAVKPERPADVYREGVRGEWPMALFYTSGTTGMPKGVPYTVERSYERAAGRRTNELDDDRWYDCMPYYHGTGGVLAMSCMMTGLTLCIGKRFSTSKFWQDVHDSRATWITYVGETARYLLAAPPSPLDKDHHVRGMYGNGLRPDVWFKFRERFGVSEMSEFFASSEGVFGLINNCRGDYLATCVGHHGAILRYRFKDYMVPVLIDQASGEIARDPKTGFAYRQPYETGGEMIVQVPNEQFFPGYYNNPGATAKKFERNVFKKGDLWYRSGDALRRTLDGRWFFMDRLGDTFRWKGENVSTAEVAEVLGKYPGVVEANVYGVVLPFHDGKAGCAAVYIDPAVKKNFDYAGLLKYARVHLPRYAVPVFVRIVKEMTPIHNNKQNKVPLREEGVDPTKVKLEDKVLWIDENGKGHSYVDFHVDQWEDLKLGRAKL
ncbi:long-chain fatty acid transporter-like protein [Mollisia scopiformis]|uniref:Very long-chain fatty acid transport protein n=1 Tax=Mollisia scopiformis TaxID=149040 RepID=A0A194XU55_MOLSC|nr:long-chain fatty acid transporter-like protein [Mollisia scopiformis]KUJ23569.1 long-chain fatty acid transporter-like protein [Mollisia scopiformis]